MFTSTPAKAARLCRPIGVSRTSCRSRLTTLSCSKIRPTMPSWRTGQAGGPPPTRKTQPPTSTPSQESDTSVGQTTRSRKSPSRGRPLGIRLRSILSCGPNGKMLVTYGPLSHRRIRPRPTVQRPSLTCTIFQTGTSRPLLLRWRFRRPARSRKRTMRSTWPSSSTSTNPTTRTNSPGCTNCRGCACTP